MYNSQSCILKHRCLSNTMQNVSRQYGNYGNKHLVPPEHRITAYCKPVYVQDGPMCTITNKYSMSKYITHWTIAFVTAIIMLLVHYGDSTVVQTLRLKQFDILQTTDQPSVSQDIVVVAIDEPAIEKFGQWPWKREVLADIIWKLREAGAGIIVLPILMSETDRLGGDIELAQALVDNGVVIAQAGTTLPIPPLEPKALRR